MCWNKNEDPHIGK